MADSLREIVSLVPVKQLLSAALKDKIMKVISIVQACGYVVVVLASDNIRLMPEHFRICAVVMTCVQAPVIQTSHTLMYLFFLTQYIYLSAFATIG